jgi:PTH1 family peptidyl-tRNA hydrolase
VKLIVGLGNPGEVYKNSRHNIGFYVVKSLGRDYRISFKKEKNSFSLSGKGKIDNQNLILAMPLTFMNFSGACVAGLIKEYKIDLDSLLVVLDDLDLEFGRLKIRPCGSSAGHLGLKSIIESLKTQEFCRLRIGIGRPPKNTKAAKFVLSPFTRREKEQLKEISKKASECCRVWATEGILKAMNIFNRGN